MPTSDNAIRVVVGRLGRPHGIRGEITVDLRTDEPESRLAPGSLLYSQAEPKAKPLEVATFRWQGNHVVLSLAGYADRTAVEQLRGTILEVEVDPDELPEDEDEYYDRQLVGLRVVVEGAIVGEVTEVLHLPGQDVFVIASSKGELLLPFVEQFVSEVDLESGEITATPPPGLFDEQAEEA